ncbi:MAG: DUF4956 domain-containing protein [Verrucomicrobia bacterium]|nr:DUF4956 domain-containing protein [Verrucomicrobiota bacterium]MCH8525821.1 DUF4956 domain-containing protein [Kiritimatiellia bacterium]
MQRINSLEALSEFQQMQEQIGPGLLVLSLVTSLGCAYLAAGLYRLFYESRGTGSQVHRAFPLLGISITALFIAIQTSLPLALGLLGSMSIIRFRTPIKEPEEIGFIMLVIASSICIATYNFHLLFLLNTLVILSLILVRGARTWNILRRSGLLIVSLPDEDFQKHLSELEAFLRKETGSLRLENSSSRGGETNLQYSFTSMKNDVAGLQNGLRNITSVSSVHIYLDRAGGSR